jgi:DNA (cytosine-5)-methyltransferase 1
MPDFRRAFEGELIVDSFAGGGGASTGIELALGRSPDIAINHDAAALAMHIANHPASRHFVEDIRAIDPSEACQGRPVGLAWFSPDCKHFSKAKGGKPRDKAIRGLAWVVVRWARAVRPRVIILENVEEFKTWGPLDENGNPIKARAGETFREWLGQIQRLGYHVEYRNLVAANYGTPTTRKRFFLIARCDGHPIVWPSPTHGKGCPEPWRPAADIIDWSIPCRSIFGRRKPLADNTLARIAAGVRRYVIESARPYIISHYGQSVGRALSQPLPTVTAGGQGHQGLVCPTLIQTGYGEREGQAPRCLDIRKPLGTVVAGGAKHAVVAAWLTKHYTGVVGQTLDAPLGTVTARDHHSLTVARLGSATADRRAEVRAFLVKYYSSSGQQQSLFDPLHTVTVRPRFGLVMIEGKAYEIADIGMRMLQPHELFAAQGFPADYVVDIPDRGDGKPLTKKDKYALCGNAVCPQVAAAIVRANSYAAEARCA